LCGGPSNIIWGMNQNARKKDAKTGKDSNYDGKGFCEAKKGEGIDENDKIENNGKNEGVTTRSTAS